MLAGSNQTEAAGFFSGEKILSMPSFGREVKPSQNSGMIKNPVITWKLGHRQN
jgi:hypothetical protein